MSDFIESCRLIDRIQDSNINFLFGSGMSAGYLEILGNIENLLTELDKEFFADQKQKDLIRASILNKYFEGVIEKNSNILDETSTDSKLITTLNSYKTFFRTINQLILLRRNKLLSKQVNIFTTNIDVFLEKSIEQVGLESNDGFGKGFKPKYDLSNFKKSIFQKSLHFDNSSEIPVFNILKIHGSLTWKYDGGNIYFDNSLEQIQKVKSATKIDLINVVTKDSETTKKDDLTSLISKLPTSTIDEAKFSYFLEEYNKLSIVNPTKGKFQQTVLDQKYYDLLRIYANELERENTLLFVMGFSFADEHIRDLTIRVANSNPTLMIYIFAHTTHARGELEKVLDIENNVKNKNIAIVSPSQSEQKEKTFKDDFSYDFNQINERVFKKILEKISKPLSKKIFKATLEGFENE
ncbi:SIR2 family protein [Aliarcobacter butzleri]|uniref:SIR2 family protein n=1 Tax=Aliarcobacter butzleri TaxID=28197 RepID=UPI0021B4DC7D|nr:SIR2 family protein [Aliarcobacter butzleri]MCT7649514.1 SIR2 family protein [Aliarcobacter butzleri]